MAHTHSITHHPTHTVQDGHQKHLVYKGAWDAIRSTFRREGWRAFYNGLVPAWVGSGVCVLCVCFECVRGRETDRERGRKRQRELTSIVFKPTITSTQSVFSPLLLFP